MSTTFEVRRAATSHWIRRTERDWVRTPRALGAATNSRRPAFGPVRELLTCDRAVLQSRGRDTLRWLDEQKNIQTTILDWLSHRVISDRIAGQVIGDFNRLAAIEILARYNHRSVPLLIDRYLAEPIRENHLYAMPLARLQQTIKSVEIASITASIVRLYGESRAAEFAPRWRERFSVETFRTLAETSPVHAVGTITSDLPNVAAFELTPILESISQAARKVSSAVLAESVLRASLLTVWDRFVADKSTENLGHRPGIMGRLLELLGRTGQDPSPCLASLHDHPLRMQVLYQFLRRPLDFAEVDNRFHWYADALRLMVEAKQNLAIRKFLAEIVVPDMPPDLQQRIISKLTKREPGAP